MIDLSALRMLLMAVVGWLDRREREVIAQLVEENRLLYQQLGGRHRVLADAGVRVFVTPIRAPNANAYAERFVRSIKEECSNRLIPVGDRHFRRAVAEFVEHYRRERNHQGLGNALIAGRPAIDAAGRVRRRARLGGLLNDYQRAA